MPSNQKDNIGGKIKWCATLFTPFSFTAEQINKTVVYVMFISAMYRVHCDSCLLTI